MSRLGVFLLGAVIILLVGGMGIKPAMDGLYGFMNTTSSINIGSGATNRSLSTIYGKTYIDQANPVSADGTITSVEIWADINLSGCKVGTFYLSGTNVLSCRDVETISNVTADSKQTFSNLSLTVEENDYIGIYFATGTLDWAGSGGTGLWFYNGDHCVIGDVTTYTNIGGRVISLYGIGLTLDLSPTETVAWRFMPYLIMLILFIILVAWLTGKIGGHQDSGEE